MATVSAENVQAGGGISNFNCVAQNDIVTNNYYGLPNERQQSLAKWVSEHDSAAQQSAALQKYTSGTLGWVFEDPVIKTWLAQEKGGIIWGSGKPGAGKTTLAAFLIDRLEKQFGHTVCYVHFRYDISLTVLQIFEIILQQLILRFPSPPLPSNKIQKRKDRGERLSLEEILSIIRDLSAGVPNIFIILDALDECSEDCRLQVLFHLQSLPSLKIMITARECIKSLMNDIPMLPIVATEEDLKTHFRAQTKINDGLATLVSKVRDVNVEAKLVEKAGGMFLLAELHTAHLGAQTTVTQFRSALNTLPREAMASYDQTLDRICRQKNKKLKQIALRCLAWIFHSPRPLSFVELQHALAIHEQDQMATEEDLVDKRTIISSCAGLIAVNTMSVDFLHYTVKEYFQQQPPAEFPSDADVAICWMKLVSFPGIKANPPNYPLICDATSTWGAIVKQHEHETPVLDLALSQLRQSGPVELLTGYHISKNRSDRERQTDLSAIYLTAKYDLIKTYMAYKNIRDYDEARLQMETHRQSALLWAVKGRRFTLVEDFLSNPSVDVNLKDKDGQTSLNWAVQRAPQKTSNLSRSASQRDHLKVVKQLLRCPNVDVNSRDKFGRTPLCWAAQNGSLEVVEGLVCCADIDVNARDNDGRTPLSRAAEQGHLQIVKLLCGHPNINVNLQDEGTGHTPLSRAAERVTIKRRACKADRDDSDLVKELLNHPNIDISSALAWAAKCGHVTAVKELCNHRRSLDFNSQENYFGRTALSLAAENGHRDVVLELCNHPLFVSINVADRGTGRTPLSWAFQKRHYEVFRVLANHINIELTLNEVKQLYREPYPTPSNRQTRRSNRLVSSFKELYSLIFPR